MEWLETAAPSVKTAKEIALDRLGVHESDAEFEVITEGKIGLFGRVREEARVRARVLPTPVRAKRSRGRGRRSRQSGGGRANRRGGAKHSGRRSPSGRSSRDGQRGQNNRPRAASAEKQATADKMAKAGPKSSSSRQETGNKTTRGNAMGRHKNMRTQETRLSLAEQADLAESFVRGVGETVGITLTFLRHDLENNVLRIEAQGEGIGLLVGRRAVTAQAIDDLAKTVLQRTGGVAREGRIWMDIGGVRGRRNAALAKFAKQLAAEVVDSGLESRLEPMSRADRKIVHDTVSEISGVTSRSEGSDPRRNVVIGLSSETR